MESETLWKVCSLSLSIFFVAFHFTSRFFITSWPSLQGFKRKEFRGRLAIAITANFVNRKTEAEARVEEISGVAFIFNQKFFRELNNATGIDLENIVYYKDETHYFVMTAKKQSLLNKRVIIQVSHFLTNGPLLVRVLFFT